MGIAALHPSYASESCGARNTLFTILIDPLFTTFMRRAFTKTRDATRVARAIA
ncbi:hypothetical protein H8B02_33430 [Bradyrhizobium sp. Pear77]|uniref:hypothetical protein n=1 Tax=Bradyrhizobium altum TaxID=1571202 RepID=UPI001E46EABE|nr:hypothetical protein [Bradyrhizobium altum]MCC8958148.1 hypothetical protein [Bradyrhizobium altum]